MEAFMTRRARFVESTTFRRRCASVFMSGRELSRTDDLAHADRFLSNVFSVQNPGAKNPKKTTSPRKIEGMLAYAKDTFSNAP